MKTKVSMPFVIRCLDCDCYVHTRITFEDACDKAKEHVMDEYEMDGSRHRATVEGDTKIYMFEVED